MSHLLALAQAVVATPVPTPVPTPDLSALAQFAANAAATKVAGPSAVVVQAAQLGGIFASALVLSLGHRLVEWLTAKEKGWDAKVNVLVATIYSAGVGVAGAAVMNQLGVDLKDIVTVALTTSVALTGSFWTYAIRKAWSALFGSSLPAPAPLATDEAPA